MAFAPPAGMHVYADSTDSYLDGAQHPYQIMADPKTAYYATAIPPPQISCDIKPRLTKEQHDILEAHYQEQNKPNTVTKKRFAESLNVSLDKVNVCRSRKPLVRFYDMLTVSFPRIGFKIGAQSQSRMPRKQARSTCSHLTMAITFPIPTTCPLSLHASTLP
jgi:hypothetical protein